MVIREFFTLHGLRFTTRRRQWELKEAILSRAAEMRVLVKIRDDPDGSHDSKEEIKAAALKELDHAEEKLRSVNPNGKNLGMTLAVAQTHLDTAHSLLLRLTPVSELEALLPGLVCIVREHLSVTDLRRDQVEQIEQQVVTSGQDLDAKKRELLIDAVGVARQSLLRENLRVRSFVGIVHGMSVVLAVIAITAAVLGAFFPDVVPICFGPMDNVGIVCPTGDDPSRTDDSNLDSAYSSVAKSRDYAVIELAGMGAAAVAAAVTLRKIRGTSTPYNVPVALALLKLPTGALTALLGLLLMRGSFVPGLTALDSSAQIIGWAIVFGYAQQIFTRLVDQQGQAVLDAVGGPASAHSASGRDPADTSG